MKIIKHTESICPICYDTINARIYQDLNTVRMVKNCICGEWDSEVEKDIKFYTYIDTFSSCGGCASVAFLDVTDKCNINCKYCHWKKDNIKPDRNIEEVLTDCRQYVALGYESILIQGAEATCRNDLPELIRRIKNILISRNQGGTVALLTNGYKLADVNYLVNLYNSGLNGIYFSVHPKEYSSSKIYEKKLQAIENIYNIGERIESFIFTVDDLNQLEEVIDFALNSKGRVLQLRIRGAQNYGSTENAKPIYNSDLFKKLQELASSRNIFYEVSTSSGSNQYCVAVKFGDINIRLTSGPTKYNIDIGVKNEFCLKRKGKDGQIYNVVQSFIMDEKYNKGE